MNHTLGQNLTFVATHVVNNFERAKVSPNSPTSSWGRTGSQLCGPSQRLLVNDSLIPHNTNLFLQHERGSRYSCSLTPPLRYPLYGAGEGEIIWCVVTEVLFSYWTMPNIQQVIVIIVTMWVHGWKHRPFWGWVDWYRRLLSLLAGFIFYVSLTQATVITEEGASVEKMPL